MGLAADIIRKQANVHNAKMCEDCKHWSTYDEGFGHFSIGKSKCNLLSEDAIELVFTERWEVCNWFE